MRAHHLHSPYYGSVNRHHDPIAKAQKLKHIKDELRDLDVSRLGLLTAESRYLPAILHDDEHLLGVAYGYHKGSTAMLAATDRRVVFIDKKPLFVHADELTYEIIGGVSFGQAGIFATVTLHTRIGDYAIKTLNAKAAGHFVDYIENRCLDKYTSETW
jgi:hypothetical protein